jgi:hypothetical protein
MKFFSRIQPRSAASDLMKVIRAPTPHKLGIFGVSVVISFMIIYGVYTQFRPLPRTYHSQITYVTSWNGKRTLAQVVAQQKIDAPKEAAAKTKAKAEDEAAIAKRKAVFQRVAKTLHGLGAG